MAIDTSALPSIDSILEAQRSAPIPTPAADIPSANPVSAAISGVKQGFFGGIGSTLSGVAAGAKVVGADGAADFLARAGQHGQDLAAANARPDLTWTGAPISKLANTVGNIIPSAAAIGAITAGSGGLAVPSVLARLGALAPEAIGGGGGLASGIVDKVALDAGANLARGVGAGAAVMVPQSVGGMYEAAEKQPGGASQADAARAIAMGLPLGIAQGIAPGGGASSFVRGVSPLVGNTLSRVAQSGLGQAAAGALGAGLQTAGEQSFDNTTPPGDKAKAIVDSVVQGAISGGLMGAAFGFMPHGSSIEAQRSALDAQMGAAGLKPETADPLQITDQRGGSQTGETQQVGGPPNAPQLTKQNNLLETDLVNFRPVDRQLPGRQDEIAGPGDTPQITDTKLLPAPDAATPTDAAATADKPQVQSGLVVPDATPDDTRPLLTQVADSSGLKSQTLRGAAFKDLLAQPDVANAQTLGQLRAAVEPLLEQGHPFADHKDINKLTEALGITDKNGNGRELGQELQSLQDSNAPQAQIDRVQTLIDAANEAKDIRSRADTQGLDTTPTGSLVPKAQAEIPAVHAPEDVAAALEAGDKAAADDPHDIQGMIDDVNKDASDESTTPTVQEPSTAGTPADPQPGSVFVAGGGDTPAIRPAGTGVEAFTPIGQTRPTEPAGQGRAPQTVEPLSIKDTVAQKAQELIGQSGGRLPIGQLRDALPQISKTDFASALKDLHSDESDHGLVQAPAGQRAGVDGVSIGAGGKYHFLEVPPKDSAVDVKPGDTAPNLTAAQALQFTYPGDGDAANHLGLTPISPELSARSPEAAQAVRDRMQLMWQMAQKGEFGTAYYNTFREVEAVTGGKVGNVVRPDGTIIPKPISAFEQYRLDQKAAAAKEAFDGKPNTAEFKETPSKTGPVMGSKAMRGRDKRAASLTDVKPGGELQTPTGTKVQLADIGTTPAENVATLTKPPAMEANPAPEPTIKVKPAPDPLAAWNADTGASLASKAAQGRTGPYTPAYAKEDFAAILDKFKPEVQARIHLLNTFSDLPTSIKANTNLRAATTGAMYTKGQIYIMADKLLSRADLQDSVAHEALGHMANRDRFAEVDPKAIATSDWYRSMAHITDRAGGFAGIEKLAKDLGVWEHGTQYGHNLVELGAGVKSYFPSDYMSGRKPTTTEKARLAEEIIAHAAAVTDLGDPRQTAIQAMASKVKVTMADVFRKFGFEDFANRFNSFGHAELAQWVTQNREMLLKEGKQGDMDLSSVVGPTARILHDTQPGTIEEAFARNTGSGIAEPYNEMSRAAGPILDRINKFPASEALRTAKSWVANLQSTSGMARMWKQYLPEMTDHLKLSKVRQAIEARLNQTSTKVHIDLDKFGHQYRAAGGLVQQLLQATEHGLNPLKTWAEHTHLRDDPTAGRLKEEHDRLRGIVNKLNQGVDGSPPGLGIKLYKDEMASGRFQNLSAMAIKLHTMEYKGGPKYDPMEKFAGLHADTQNEANTWHNDINAAEKMMRGEVDARMKAAEDHLQAVAADPIKALSAENVELKQAVDQYKDGLQKMDDGTAPYAHLGRQGNQGVAFTLAANEAGDGPHVEKTAQLQAALQKAGFGDVSINSVSGNRKVFARLKNQDDAQRFAEVIKNNAKLTEDGVTWAAPLDHESASVDHIASGKKTLAAISAKWDSIILAANEGDREALTAQKAQAMGYARASLHNSVPDNSIRTLLSQREGVQGYSSNMLRNQIQATQIRSRANSHTSVSGRQDGLEASMAQRVADAKRGGDVGHATRMADRLAAWQQRNAASSVQINNSFLNATRSITHSYFVGASPGYMLMQVAQLGSLTMPEFAKHHGYARTMAAMSSGLADAAKVAAVLVRPSNILHGVTPEILAKSGLPQDKIDHIMSVVNRGEVELGSYARAAEGLGENRGVITNGLKGMQNYANATGTLAEVVARLTTALAAKHLYENAPARVSKQLTGLGHADATSYATHTMQESMFNWGSYDTPRMFTAGGPFGKAGPLMFQFHQFSTKMVEKIAHESMNGFVHRGEDAAGSRQFMYAHLAATTLLAGSLGLPFAGAAAGAATRLSGIFNEGQGVDFASGWRTFLAGMFGKDMGEVLARGVPRYLGTDLSDLGDGGLAPFGRLLEDRRKFEDAFPAYLAQSWGTAPNTMANMVVAMRDIGNGRVLPSMAKVLPTALRSLARTYELSENGYTNSKYERLPLPVSAVDLIRQSLGFESGAYRELMDKTSAATAQVEDRQFRSGMIKQNVAMALEHGDREGATTWLNHARAFDQDPANLGSPMTPTISPFLAQRRRDVAVSSALKTPLGVMPKDLPVLKDINY